MQMIITDKKNYIKNLDIRQYDMSSLEGKVEKKLFNKTILLENDSRYWHLHLKVTNKCQANCNFCIEKGLSCKEDTGSYLSRLDKVLSEMESQGILYSVSVTGGEPLLFKDFKGLVDTLRKHDIKFLTMNTNGAFVRENISLIDEVFDFIDISRHSVSDSENQTIFGSDSIPSLDELRGIKMDLRKTKVRLQCVISNSMTYSQFLNLLDEFSFADDVSFRRLMSTSDIHNVSYDSKQSDDSFTNILANVYNDFNLVEQTLQDYYVYETWEKNGQLITLSYSDMKTLTSAEKVEDDRLCRELILHPNGVLSGSWDYNKKVILP